MWLYFIITFLSGSLLMLVVMLANKNGSKAAQLEALKAELKKQAEEQERANRINNSVASLTPDNARELLHKVSNEQSKRMQ